MHTKSRSLYEYAVVRFLPRVERGEFINIGLLMMCKRKQWVNIAFNVDMTKLAAFGCTEMPEELTAQLDSMKRIIHGDKSSGPIASLPPEERFRWLTAVRSACLQTSSPHPGLTEDLETTFNRLMSELIY